MAIPFLNNIIVDDAGHIQFKTAAGANAGKIDQSGDDLVLSNAVGDIIIGNGSDDVYIGDGTNAVDIRFEQNMAIYADSSSTRTLTLGGANTSLVLESPTISGTMTLGATTINNKLTFTTSSGYIVFDYEPSGDTGEYTTEVPLLKVDMNGSESTILSRVSEYRAVVLGIDDTVWLRAGDTGTVIKANVGLTTEQVLMSAEGGFIAYGFPGNDTTWSNRNEFQFRTDSTTASDNGLYIGDGGRTQFIDLSRNLKNIGTISNTGDITITNGNIIFSSQYGARFNDANTRIYTNTDSPEDLLVEADQDILLTPDRYVGVNTTAPASVLHVNTGSGTQNSNTIIVDRASSSDYSGVSFATAGTVDWSIGQNSAGTFEVYEDGQDAQTRLTIASGGDATFAGAITMSGVLDGVTNMFLGEYLYHQGDGDTYLHFQNANEFRIVVGGSEKLHFNTSRARINQHLYVAADSTYDIGTSSARHANIYADSFHGDGSNITGVTATDSTKLPLAGGTMSGDIVMGNNDITGVKFIQANGNVDIRTGSGEYALHATQDGQTSLYHNGTKKFETTSVGIDVVGEVQGDSLDIDGSADISGTLAVGQTTINSGSDNIFTLNQTSTDNKWSYIDFKSQGTREWFIGMDASGNFDLYNDNINAYAITVGYTNNHINLKANTVVEGTLDANTINTGQGDTEVYLMNQNVRTTDDVTFDNLTVTGNLSITGDINSYNVTDLDVEDKTITVGSGQNAANSGSSGLIINRSDSTNPSMLWNQTDGRFEFNSGVTVSGQLHTTGSAFAKGALYVVDTDGTNNHIQARSNGTEGYLTVSNGSNWGFIVRGPSNDPRIGAWHGGTLKIEGFHSSDGATGSNAVDLAQFKFADAEFNVNGDITLTGTVDGVDIAALAAANTGTNTGDQDLSGLVTKASAQTISGAKTFSSDITMSNNKDISLTCGSITSDGTTFAFDGAGGKEVLISSARDVRVVIDDNDDDTNNTFEVHKHSFASGNELLTLNQSGNLAITGTVTANGTTLTGDQDLSSYYNSESDVTQHQGALSINYSQLTGTVPTWNQNTTGSAGSVPWSGISSKPTFVVNSALSSRSTAAPDTAGDSRGVTFNYMNGSASPAPTGTDHSLMTMAYSDAWQTQLAQDWREEGRMYVRGQENGTWSSWNQVWDSSDFTKASVLNSNVTLSSLGAAASSHNHDDRYYTETESDARYLRSDYKQNFIRVGYGNSGSVRYHKLVTITVDSTYDDYNATFEWTGRYSQGIAGIHVHSDNDTTADVMGAWYVDWNPVQKLASQGWIKYTQSGDTVEVWVKTNGWREFDYIIKDSVTEGTPTVTWYTEDTTTDQATEPSNLNAFSNNNHFDAGYSTATGVANNADVTPSWVPSSNPNYISDYTVTQSDVTQHVAAIAHDSLSGFVANEHIDWSAENAGTIHSSNISFPSDNNTFRTIEVDTSGNGSADNTLTASETLRFKKGSNVSLSEANGVITIAATNTTYSIGDGGLTTNDFTDNDHDKLDSIAENADVTPSWVPSSDPGYGTSNLALGTTSTTALAGNTTTISSAQSTKLGHISVTQAVDLDTIESNAHDAYGWGNHASAGYLTSSSTQSKYLRSDTADTAGGNITFSDNVEIRLGTGADFRMEHNGSNTIFRNYNHGNTIYFQSENSSGTNQNCIIWGGAGGYAELRYNNASRITTTSGGWESNGVVSLNNKLELTYSATAGGQFEQPSTSVQTFRCNSDRFRIYMGGAGNSQETLTVAETGRVGINDSTPDYTLDVSGNVSNTSIYASHDIVAYSDIRVKDEIETITDALEKVNKLRGVTFVRTDEGSSDKRMMGVIAQEVEEVIPEVVTTKDSDGHKAVAYGNMVGVLIEAVKELTAEVEELKKLKCKCDGCTK